MKINNFKFLDLKKFTWPRHNKNSFKIYVLYLLKEFVKIKVLEF